MTVNLCLNQVTLEELGRWLALGAVGGRAVRRCLGTPQGRKQENREPAQSSNSVVSIDLWPLDWDTLSLPSMIGTCQVAVESLADTAASSRIVGQDPSCGQPRRPRNLGMEN